MKVVPDPQVDFPAVFAKGGDKIEQRRLVAEYALSWIKYQKGCGERGCIVFDIDDTLVDGHERVAGGFQFMVDMYAKVHLLFPIHIVTARPNQDHAKCLKLLESRGIIVPPDRLHMLQTELWGEDLRHVEEFKWRCHVDFVTKHKSVVARFGDKLWDVAHIQSLSTYLSHVQDRDCYIFFDPYLKGTLSCKLPGQ